jgi:thiamine biosynthesis lipoprotein
MSYCRRARPMLGTLVEISVDACAPEGCLDQAFAALADVQAALSRFDDRSDITRFAMLPAGKALTVREDTAAVLQLAAALHQESDGLFDITLGSGPEAWSIVGRVLRKHRSGVTFDLGGIGKGHAVDRAVSSLQAHGVQAGWVNAGGDLRVFGEAELPVAVRDEALGGARPFIALRDGALATSRYAVGSRCHLSSRLPGEVSAHCSVAAPQCVWADALTKVVALSGDLRHPLLERQGAHAWWH